jgi:hypothetical protein
MDIDAGGQTFQMHIASSGTFGTTFTRSPDGIQVAMHVRKFSGKLDEPMQGPMMVDETAIAGPLVFTLDRRGAVALLSAPKVSGSGDRMFEPMAYANSFFPHLPGGPVTSGFSWTDTIHFESPATGGTTRQTSVITYTVSGDTLVAGRSLLRIALQGTSEQASDGTLPEMDADFSQSLKGNLQGWVLWDAGRRLMVERYTASDGRGTMNVSMAPGPMDIHMRQVSRAKLGEGM